MQLKNKFYLITEITAYAEDVLSIRKFAKVRKKDAEDLFLELRNERIKDMLEYYGEESYMDLMDNHIDRTDDNSSFFGYITTDGREEYELEITHMDVY